MAAAAAANSAATVAANAPCVTCGLCFGILSDPVTVRCGHSFCLRCLKGRLDRSGVGGKFRCSLCNTADPDLSLRNVNDLIDGALQQRLQALSRGAEGRPMCQWCEEAPATLYCGDCTYTLCSDCTVAVHKNAAKRSHAPVPLQDAKTMRNMCRKCTVRGHEEYRLEFYCVNCEALACAYCLQVGPHRGHESVLVSVAAQDVRKQMARDLESLGQIKARIEGQAGHLNQVHETYMISYDNVESKVADRFNTFKQQLLQKEVEVRKILASLRESGDNTLAEARAQFLRKINAINEAGMSFRRLQHGGSDVEVLQNRAVMSAFLRLEVPQVNGIGFHLPELGDLNLVGLSVLLDLTVGTTIDGIGAASVSAASAQQHAAAAAAAAAAATPAPSTAGTPAMMSREAPPTQRQPLRLTFAPDPDIEVRQVGDGLLFKCSEAASARQIGMRSNETFESLRPYWQAEGGLVSWRVRLDQLQDSFLGVVEPLQGAQSLPEGFYWRPMKTLEIDGKIGRPTHALRTIPACRPGDVVKLTYDANAKTIKLAINGIDKGVILSEVPSQLCPCFIFRPGEALTLLF